MFAVRCPVSMLWHPTVHHSLLLLRALQQSHTLQVEPHTTPRGRLPVPLLSECALELRISYQGKFTESKTDSESLQYAPLVLYRPDDVLHVLRCPPCHWNGPALSLEMQETTASSLVLYLEASTVSNHIAAAVDALLVSLNAGDMETVRQTHAQVMELVERLETSLTDEDVTGAPTTPSTAEPLSTWPLFCILQFLIEEGGLLLSAFPHITKAYARLCDTSKAIAHHRRLVQRTVDEQLDVQATSRAGHPVELAYPAKGFLRDAQRHLASYNRSMEERTTEGVSGDKGPLRSRVSGGRLGIQAVPARLPWTLQGTPLKRP